MPFIEDCHQKQIVSFTLYPSGCVVIGILDRLEKGVYAPRIVLKSESGRVTFEGEIPAFTNCLILTDTEWVMDHA